MPADQHAHHADQRELLVQLALRPQVIVASHRAARRGQHRDRHQRAPAETACDPTHLRQVTLAGRPALPQPPTPTGRRQRRPSPASAKRAPLATGCSQHRLAQPPAHRLQIVLSTVPMTPTPPTGSDQSRSGGRQVGNSPCLPATTETISAPDIIALRERDQPSGTFPKRRCRPTRPKITRHGVPARRLHDHTTSARAARRQPYR